MQTVQIKTKSQSSNVQHDLQFNFLLFAHTSIEFSQPRWAYLQGSPSSWTNDAYCIFPLFQQNL